MKSNYHERKQNRIGRYKELSEKAEGKKAQHYEDKAEAAESNTAISSDNPDALKILAEKLYAYSVLHEKMKQTNKFVKKKDIEGLKGMGFSESVISQLCTPDFLGRIGFPDYKITNNGATIRNIKKRIELLEKQTQDATTERQINGVTIIDNVEENRLQLFFPSIPAHPILNELKLHSFKWSRSLGCWQRMRSSNATYYAERICALVQ